MRIFMRSKSLGQAITLALGLSLPFATLAFADDCIEFAGECIKPHKTYLSFKVEGESFSLEGIEQFKKLQAITLAGEGYQGDPIDVSPLANFENLTSFSARGVSLTGLEALSQTGITELSLSETGTQDFAFLEGLEDLISLNTDMLTSPRQIPVLALTRLKGLTIDGPRLQDLEGLDQAEGLAWLALHNTDLKDLEGAGHKPYLEMLSLNGSKTETLDGLEPGDALLGFHADRSALVDIGALASAPNLVEVQIEETPLADISPLAGAHNLEKLMAKGSNVEDISALSEKSSLKNLSLTNTQVSDLSPISGNTNLVLLGLSNTQVTDLSPLSGLTNLVGLWLNETKVQDFSPLMPLARNRLGARIGSDEHMQGERLIQFIEAGGTAKD
jgi:internalin A